MGSIMSEEREIPNGWDIVLFDDVCEIISGKNQKEVADEFGKYPIYGSGGIMGKAGDYLCEPGTTIIGRKGTINSPIFVEEYFWNVDTAFGLSPNSSYNKLLFHFFCKSFNFKKLDKSTTIPSLAKTDLLQIRIPLPPLLEQHRIVAKIEELFSSLDKGIESLKTAQEQLKIYRQAVLKWAFEGKLTRLNLDLYDSYDKLDGENETIQNQDNHTNHKNQGSDKGELPEGWRKDIVKNIAISIQYGYTESSSNSIVGPKFLRITDIQNNRVNWESVPYCPISDDEIEKYLLKDGDLVFARTGATVGKSFLIKGNIPKSVFASYLIRLRFPKDISDKYVWYYFQSPLYWNQITDKQVGTGQPNVNGTTLGKLEIIVAPLSEQHHIVSEIEKRLSVCDKIEESISTSLQQAEALRQSILKKAFEGKLVKQDPNDEPASVLLERIKAEREALRQAQGKNKPAKKAKEKKVKEKKVKQTKSKKTVTD